MKRRIALLAVAAAPSAIALIAAAFVSFASGSLSSPGPYGSTATASAPNGAAAATVDTPKSPLGRTVIDGQGRTLYPFERDKQNGRSAPDGQCASGEATYAGHPLRAGCEGRNHPDAVPTSTRTTPRGSEGRGTCSHLRSRSASSHSGDRLH